MGYYFHKIHLEKSIDVAVQSSLASPNTTAHKHIYTCHTIQNTTAYLSFIQFHFHSISIILLQLTKAS